ncbi:MAG: GGDEF domain-containing protein [Clostridia bacterium]|nr:GGDEF domain-containing protein [Clostridia bacterium]
MRRRKSLIIIDETVEKFGGDPERLITELRRLAREGQKESDARFVGVVYNNLATVYHELGDHNGIFENALKSVALLKDLDGPGDGSLQVSALSALGYAYADQENNQMALACYEEASRIIKKHRIKGRIRTSVINNLASSYHAMGDYKTSARIHRESLELVRSERPDDYSALAMYSINLSQDYQDSDEPLKAKELLDSMEPWIGMVSFLPLRCDYYLRLAMIAYILGEPEKGNGYVDRAFDLLPDDPIPDQIYDDLRQTMHFVALAGDRDRAGRILGLMTAYYEKETGTMERLMAFRAISEYHSRFGENDAAAECCKTLDELYSRRFDELKKMQLNVHKRIKAANGEIDRLKKKMRKNEEMYSLEPLTGLLNRSALLETASGFIKDELRKKGRIGAIFIDIDNFKEFNDTYGHIKGDEIIRTVARACREEETASIRFARYGGDEFFGITRGLDDGEVADVARRICAGIRAEDIPNEKSPNGHRVTLSVGIVNVAVSERTDTIIEIANFADKAVYYAKNAGKNAIYLLSYNGGKSGSKAEFVKIDF